MKCSLIINKYTGQKNMQNNLESRSLFTQYEFENFETVVNNIGLKTS